MIVHVYILRGSDNTHYTGMTKCLQKRLEQHYGGESKSTRNKRPLELIYHIRMDGYANARQLEKRIKALGALKFLNRNAPSVVYRQSG